MVDQKTGHGNRAELEQEIGKGIGHELGREIGRKIAIGMALLFGFAAFVIVGGVAVQQLWNWLVPDLLGVRRLTFWQALGLLALCRILFGGFGKGCGSHSHRESKRSDVWRAAREEWHHRSGEPPATPATPASGPDVL